MSPLQEQVPKANFAAMTETLRKISTHKDVYPAIAPDTYDKSEYEKKVVIVTGSGSGIGKATGLAFSELGASVAFTDLTQESAQAAADEATQKFGNKTIAVAGNVVSIKDMENLVAETWEKLGPIDVVVFCAGYGMFDTFAVSRMEDWWGLIEVNLKGPTDLTRLVLPDMIKRDTGTLIYIASRVNLGCPV
jgi:NADP-dependent 3-hydroxy acid dehydrogenase YdfG